MTETPPTPEPTEEPAATEEELVDPGAAPPPDVPTQDDGEDPEPDEGDPEPAEDTD